MLDATNEYYVAMALAKPGFEYLNYSWIVNRISIQASKYPYWNDTVVIDARRSPYKNIYDVWEVLLRDGRGDHLIRIVLYLVLLNVKLMQPVLLNHILPKEYMKETCSKDNNFKTIPSLERCDREAVFPVQFNDLDLNKHVSSFVYIKWACESVPAQILMEYQLQELDISYKKQTSQLGKKITSQIQSFQEGTQPSFLHRIIENGGTQELARLRTRWKKVSESKARRHLNLMNLKNIYTIVRL